MAAVDLAHLQRQIEELEAEIQASQECMQEVSEVPPAELATSLLNAYLYDLPFDRGSFALWPNKIAFLREAFNTCDLEIIVSCLWFVKQSLHEDVFEELLAAAPEFRAVYDRIAAPKRPFLRMTRDTPAGDERIQALEQGLPGASDVMKAAIQNELKRLRAKDPHLGVLKVDDAWQTFQTVAQSKRYVGFHAEDFVESGFFGRWEKGIDPVQGAIMAKWWGFPDDVVKSFATRASTSGQEELRARRLLV